MLHTMLALKRPLICLDCETTGLDEHADRIIELAFQVFEPERGMTKEWKSLINPGMLIPKSVTDIHHITNEAILACRVCSGMREEANGNFCTCEEFKPWPTFKQLAENLAKGFTHVDWAGQNVKFDLRMLGAEFARANVEWSLAGARIIDSSRLEALGEPRHLSDLYTKHTGKRAIDAHQALADVRMTTDVIVAQLRKYQTLPRDLDALHALQWPGQIDLDGKFKFVDGVPCFAQWGKYAGKTMAWVAQHDRGYYDFILKVNFSADVKALARDALAGRFPEAR